MCVCVFWIYVLNIFLVKRWFWELKILFGSLVVYHAWLHSYLCFSLLVKLFLSNLNSCWKPLDSYSIVVSVEPLKLDTSWSVENYELLYIRFAWIQLHFSSISLDSLHLFTSQNISLSHSKLHPQLFFSLDQVFLHW